MKKFKVYASILLGLVVISMYFYIIEVVVEKVLNLPFVFSPLIGSIILFVLALLFKVIVVSEDNESCDCENCNCNSSKEQIDEQ